MQLKTEDLALLWGRAGPACLRTLGAWSEVQVDIVPQTRLSSPCFPSSQSEMQAVPGPLARGQRKALGPGCYLPRAGMCHGARAQAGAGCLQSPNFLPHIR